MSDAVTRRRRDPETRRREIVAAAAELIVEVGVGALTHRMIAARAGVPLGATTQYFATLDELRSEALRHLVADVDSRMQGIRSVLTERGATPAVIAELIVQGLADARAMEADPIGQRRLCHALRFAQRLTDYAIWLFRHAFRLCEGVLRFPQCLWPNGTTPNETAPFLTRRTPWPAQFPLPPARKSPT